MEKESCSYCNALKKGIVGDNFCSRNGVESPPDSVGNSFYLKSSELHSGEHISRLTFRGVLNGYQQYKIDNKHYSLSDDNYLIVEKGASYSSEIRSVAPIESVIVAFGDNVDVDVTRTLNRTHEKLLDNPFHISERDRSELRLNDIAYPRTNKISGILETIKRSVEKEGAEPLFFEQMHYAMMKELVENQSEIFQKLDAINGLKKSTRLELYYRTGQARDYMDATFKEKLTLNDISAVANMSPYHFLRSFKKIHKITPIEYLTQVRLKYAKYLLDQSDLSVHEITSMCGFESHSSFTRLFKSRNKMNPSGYRSQGS